MSNSILTLQNEPAQIRLRKAARVTYDLGRDIVVLQATLSVGVPILGAIVALFWTQAKPPIALAALVIVLLDTIGLDRWQKTLLKRAARFSELFDTRVLDLPWDAFTVGQPPEPEEIRRAEARYDRLRIRASLEDWYPAAVGDAPIHLARLMCQRTNLYYDSNLRHAYAFGLRCVALIFFVGVGLIAWLQSNKITDWLPHVAIVIPLVAWCMREAYRQQDTADALVNLMGQATALWSDALADKCGADHCTLRAREFQSAIFGRRSSAMPILPGVYAGSRTRLEDEMNAGAADFLAQYATSRATVK